MRQVAQETGAGEVVGMSLAETQTAGAQGLGVAATGAEAASMVESQGHQMLEPPALTL